jgi:hypothetical protein
VLVAGTVGLMLGAVLAIGIAGFPGSVCGNEIGSTAYDEQTGSFDGPAEVDIEFNCGELAVTGAEGSTWAFAGSGEGDVTPDVAADGSSLRIRGAERSFVPISKGERWDVTLPQDVALGIRVQLNAGDATIQSGAARLTEVDIQVNFGAIVAELADAIALESVDVQTNAGSASVTLPDLSLTGRLQVNAGSLEVCIPADAGVRIQTGGGLGSNNFGDAGLVQDGDTWESPGYANATTQIELEAEANLGNIALNPEDGCAEQAD